MVRHYHPDTDAVRNTGYENNPWSVVRGPFMSNDRIRDPQRNQRH